MKINTNKMISPEQQMVKEFHEVFGLLINDKPTNEIENKVKELRCNLIEEEAREFCVAETLVDKVDAMADLLYVVYGAAISYGVDLSPVFIEVHESNMSKLWTQEECMTVNYNVYDVFEVKPSELCNAKCYVVKRKSDGKIIKSPSYKPANIKAMLDLQLA